MQAGFTETRSRGDDSSIALRVETAFVQHGEVARSERGNSIGIGLNVVDQNHGIQPEQPGQLLSIYHPREVRRLATGVAHGSGNAKARTRDGKLLGLNELSNDLVRARIASTGIGGLRRGLQTPLLGGEESQPRVRSSAVARQDHSSGLRHWWPSCSIRSRASWGPQVPAG